MLNESIAGVPAGNEIRDVLTTIVFTTVANAAAMMYRKGVGTIVVRTGSGPIEGIFTERDLLSRMVREDRDPKTTKIDTAIKPDVRAVKSNATMQDAPDGRAPRSLSPGAGWRSLGRTDIDSRPDACADHA